MYKFQILIFNCQNPLGTQMANLSSYTTKLVNSEDSKVIILNGQVVSSTLNLLGSSIMGFVFPANFIAGTISFGVSADGLTFYQLKDGYSGNPITMIASPSSFLRALPADFVGIPFVQLACTATQTSLVEIQVICGPIL